MSKAIISGASGFVGTHLTKALKKHKIQPVALDRELLYNPLRLKAYLEELQPDYIFHLASYGNHYMQQEIDQIIQTNILATTALFASSVEVPYKAFINVSTSSVLLDSTTFYSATKAAGEELALAFSEKYNKPIITVRPYSLYGEGEADFRFIPTVIHSCLTGEKFDLVPYSYHDWTYIGDFVEKIIHLARNIDDLEYCSYNYGTGISTSNESVVDLIEYIAGRKARYKEIKELRSYDSTKWELEPAENSIFCKTRLTEGLIKTYEYYKQRFKA